MKIQHPTDCVVTYRGQAIENTHTIHAAVADADGTLLFAVGNPHRITLARSAAKPFQTLAVLEVERFDSFNFDESDLALTCSSHSSEPVHISRGRSMLAKIPADETVLRCGGHDALSKEVNRQWIKDDFTPSGICNNCSAKHISMYAAACVLNAAKAADYHLPDHEVQLRVARVMEELSGLRPDDIQWAVDGCNLPAPALPLRDLAYLYATLGAAPDVKATASVRSKHLSRIFNAMWRHPDLVGGKGRFCTNLMTEFGGALIGKLGADGCYGIAIRESEETRRLGAKGAIGVAVKVEDGNEEILYAAVMEILQQLDIGTQHKMDSLNSFHFPARINTAGRATGRVGFSMHVRQEGAQPS